MQNLSVPAQEASTPRKKTITNQLKWLVNQHTAALRLLPDFLIIGAQKGGTTSLYRYLQQHPYFASALRKEIHYFDVNFAQGVDWYRSHFKSVLYKQYIKQIHRQEIVTGEASPYYLFHPHAPQRVFDLIPQVKLIVMLRNPVDRAYSQYNHQVKRGFETLSFEEAIKAEPQRLQGEQEQILADVNYDSFNHPNYSYLARGIYVDQLQLWMSIFPQEQFLIIDSREFFRDTEKVFQKVLNFLDLPEWELTKYSTFNRRKSDVKMLPSTRDSLINYFTPHNQRLSEFLGMEFDWDR